MRQRTSKNIALLAVMARKKFTGQQLANETGLHAVTISKILNNRVDAKLSSISRIAKALDVPLEEIGFAEGGQ